METKARPKWWIAGLLSRCPNCGNGPLFEGILRIRSHCPNCGDSFQDADAGDGPAVLVITLAGAVLVPVLLVLMLGFKLGPIPLVLIMSPLTVITCILMLRPMKAALYALQRHKKAGDNFDLK